MTLTDSDLSTTETASDVHWRVCWTIQFKTPIDTERQWTRIANIALHDGDGELRGHDTTYWVTRTIPATDFDTAARQLRQLLEDQLADLGPTFVEVRVADDRTQPSGLPMPRLIGQTGIIRMLAIDPDELPALVRHPDFPAALADIDGSDIYDAADIHRFRRSYRR